MSSTIATVVAGQVLTFFSENLTIYCSAETLAVFIVDIVLLNSGTISFSTLVIFD